MGQPTNTHSTYDAVGNREDLSDIIYDVSPTETPFLSSIPKTKATATKHEWLTRSLAAASATNFVIEGDDATTDAANANVRKYNYRAISDKVALVSGTQEAVDKAGMRSNMAREMEDKMKELKRDVEAALLENNASVVGTDTVASECAGVPTYLITNVSYDSGGTLAAGTGADIYTDGTARALQESYVEAALALAWTNGGNPTKGFLNAFQKRKFATFSGSSTKMSDGDKKKVVNSVDFYIDPLGAEIQLVPCRQMPTDMIYFVDPEYMKVAMLRNFQSWDLAKTGDSVRKQILVEYTLEVCNEKAHAAVYDLTTS
ncbi:MAG: head protein [Candidatus Methylomirabilota bacterium]|nr:MAG: head protein [candidate division NC10 bacterium]